MRLLRPLAGTDFRRLFVGMVAARVGDAMATLVLVWITLQAHGPAALGLVLLVAALPAVVVAPVAGHLVSRVGVRRAVRLDSLARIVAMVVLAVVVAKGDPSLPVLLGFAALAGITGPATEIAVDAATPEVVPDEDLTEANALVSLVWDLSDLVGPVTAGVLLTWLGGPVVLAVVAACYALLALLVPAVPLGSVGPQSAEGGMDDAAAEGAGAEVVGGGSAQPGVLTGFRLLLTTYRSSFHLALISLFVLAASGAQEVLLPLFVSQTLGGGPAQLGLLASIFGAATLLGTALLSPRVSHLPVRGVLAVSLLVRGTGVALLGGSRRVTPAAAAGATAMVADGPFYPVVRTAQQRLVPAHHRPLVSGARGALGVAGYPLGNAAGGLLGAQVSPGTALLVLGALHLVPVLALLLLPGLRQLPGDAERGQQR